MPIDSNAIKKLRDMTSAGIFDCKKALEESTGDLEGAARHLREKGIIKAVNKMSRDTKEGSIFSYIHHNGRIGVLLELNCETDFVAKNDLFKELGKNISMHIAASDPMYVNKDEVAPEIIDEEKRVQQESLRQEGKPDNVIDKILEGKIKKFLSEICLLDQNFVKEPKLTVQDIIKETISKVGENVSVACFQRFSI